MEQDNGQDFYLDTLEDGVIRAIIPILDPKVGTIVATEYYKNLADAELGKFFRRDVHVEVSREAYQSGLVIGSRAGTIGG